MKAKNYPMRLDSPACLAIRAWLVENKGTLAEIMVATGFSLSTCEKASGSLRRSGEPEAKNIVSSRRDATARRAALAENRRQRDARRAARQTALNVAASKKRVAITEAAIKARSPLELAWAA